MSRAITTECRALSAAQEALARGWEPVALREGGKTPVHKGWPDTEIDSSNVVQMFANTEFNVGIKLGEASNDLCDVDLDSPTAQRLAVYFLPRTEAVFGREECPRSHWLYYSKNASAKKFKAKGRNGEVILEIRAGRGHQTAFPGSIYKRSVTRKSEGIVRWDDAGEPASVSVDILAQSCARLAAASLLVDGWPAGGRHDLCLALSGAMLRHGWPEEATIDFIRVVAEAGGSPRQGEIEQAVRCSHEKIQADEELTGIPTLISILDKNIVDRVCEWLGLNKGATAEDDFILATDLDEQLSDHYLVDIGGQLAIYRYRWNQEVNRLELVRYAREKFLGRWNLIKVKTKEGRPIGAGTAWLQKQSGNIFEGTVIETIDKKRVRGALNLWRGYGIEPAKGDWSLMQDHIRHVICGGDEDLYEFLLNWSAWVVQNPTKRPATALNLRGDEGTGKGIFLQFFVRTFGFHARQLAGETQMYSSFNGWVEGCLLVYLNEAMYGGNKDTGFLKALVTEDEIRINEKFLPAWEARNYTTVISSSNAERSAPLGEKDRRWIVLDVSNERANDHSYFGPIVAAIEKFGLYEAMLADLLNRDVREFNPRVIPNTGIRDELRTKSLPPIYRWWFACLCRGRILSGEYDASVGKAWPGEIEKSILGPICQKWVKENTRSPRRGISSRDIMQALTKCVPLKGTRKRRDGRPASTHETRQKGAGKVRVWVVPSLNERRRAWNENWGMTIDWDEWSDDGKRSLEDIRY